MMIDTNIGIVAVKIDLAKIPCAAASFAFLASRRLFDCRPVPTGSGMECLDPNYHRPGPWAVYRRGTVGVVNPSVDNSGANGSHFIVVYEDSLLPANNTALGTVIGGMDIIDRVAARGAQPGDDLFERPGAGRPNVALVVTR